MLANHYDTHIIFFRRNKALLDFAVDKDILDELLTKAGINLGNEVRKDLSKGNVKEVVLEAQRCLSNIYLQCSRAQDYALENDTLAGIMQQTIRYKTWQTPSQIICFDMKLLFLVTAQRPEARYDKYLLLGMNRSHFEEKTVKFRAGTFF